MDFFFSSRYYIRVKSNLNALLSCKLGSFEFLEASNHTIISGYLDRISKVWIMKKFDIQSIQVSMYPKKSDIHVSKYPCIHDIQVSTYPSIHLSKYPKKISIQDIQVSGYQKKVVSTHPYLCYIQPKSGEKTSRK